MEMSDIVIVGDLGELKVYKIEAETIINPKDDAHTGHIRNRGTLMENRKCKLTTAMDFVAAHKKLSEKLSDRFGNRQGISGNSGGESDRLKEEIERKLLREIAEAINKVVGEYAPAKWHLAFPKEHNRALTDLLDQEIKKSLDTNIPEDLTGERPDRLLRRFDG
jgi:hypothetical protein